MNFSYLVLSDPIFSSTDLRVSFLGMVASEHAKVCFERRGLVAALCASARVQSEARRTSSGTEAKRE